MTLVFCTEQVIPNGTFRLHVTTVGFLSTGDMVTDGINGQYLTEWRELETLCLSVVPQGWDCKPDCTFGENLCVE